MRAEPVAKIQRILGFVACVIGVGCPWLSEARAQVNYGAITAETIGATDLKAATLAELDKIHSAALVGIEDGQLAELGEAERTKIQERLAAFFAALHPGAAASAVLRENAAGNDFDFVRRPALGYLSWQQGRALTTKQLCLLHEKGLLGRLRRDVIARLRLDDDAPTACVEYINRQSWAYGRSVSADVASAFTEEDFNALRDGALTRLRRVAVAAVLPEVLATLPAERFRFLANQAESITVAQYDALDDEQREDIPRASFRRLREGMKPGVRLIGDAYAQLERAAGAGGAFGIGVEVIQFAFGGSYADKTKRLNWGKRWVKGNVTRWSLAIRGGSAPSTLGSREDFGRFMLTPDDEAVSLAGDLEFVGPIDTSLLFGPALAVRVATATWDASAAMMPDSDLEPESAVILALSPGVQLNYVVAQGENYMEAGLNVSYSVRHVNFVGKDEYVDEFLGGNSWFHGVGLSARLRINDVLISAHLPTIGTNVGLPGFSTGVNFYTSISLRTGAELIGF